MQHAPSSPAPSSAGGAHRDAPASSNAHAPTKDRHHSLDVLRGIAILGIFAVNVLAFGFPWQALINPALFAGAYAAGGAFWWAVSAIFFQMKFVTIFSALFGAGLILFLGAEKTSRKTPAHRRRMIWLLIIGLVHNYLLWYGDILTPYAIAGLIIAGARSWSVQRLCLVSLVLISINFALVVIEHFLLGMIPPEELALIAANVWAPPPEDLAEIVGLYKLSLFERLPHTIGIAALAQAEQFVGGFTRILGVMLAGMALYKTGFFTLGWPRARYLAYGVSATVLGLAGSLISARLSIAANFNYAEGFSASASLYWASLIQAFGYAALVMAACQTGRLSGLTKPFAAAGRMALSNYLASTLIAVFVFYGPPGLGFFAWLSYAELAAMTFGVWLFILIWSPIWMARFRFGPAEWAWRSLTYQRAQPLRK